MACYRLAFLFREVIPDDVDSVRDYVSPRGRFKHLPWLWRNRPVSRLHCLNLVGKTFACNLIQAAQKLFLTSPSLFKGIGFPVLESNGSSYRSADGPVRTCTLLIDAHSCTVSNCVWVQIVFG